MNNIDKNNINKIHNNNNKLIKFKILILLIILIQVIK